MAIVFRRLVSSDGFSSIGMTPQKGRSGHSVPTPISLNGQVCKNEDNLCHDRESGAVLVSINSQSKSNSAKHSSTCKCNDSSLYAPCCSQVDSNLVCSPYCVALLG